MVHLLVLVALIGLFDWAVQSLIPMTDKFKQIVHVLAIIAAVILVLQTGGLLPGRLDF